MAEGALFAAVVPILLLPVLEQSRVAT